MTRLRGRHARCRAAFQGTFASGLLLAVLLQLAGCESAGSPPEIPTRAEPGVATSARLLGATKTTSASVVWPEWGALGADLFKVERSGMRVTESTAALGWAPPDDLQLLTVALQRKVPEATPKKTTTDASATPRVPWGESFDHVWLVDAHGRPQTASLRSGLPPGDPDPYTGCRVSDETPDRCVLHFEMPLERLRAPGDLLLDPWTGATLARPGSQHPALLLQRADVPLSLPIGPGALQLDPSSLVTTLAEMIRQASSSGANGPALSAPAMFARFRDNTRPDRLRSVVRSNARGETELHLHFEQLALPPPEGLSVPKLRLHTSRRGQSSRGIELQIAGVVDARRTLRQIDCIARERDLRRRVDSELHGKPGTEPGEPNPRRRKRSECNLMGVMVPGPCDALPSAMKIRQEVETTRDRCGPFETPELPEASARVPDDFRVTLRVGRCGAGPRNCPRFTVSLFANGNSVFHGKDWVRTIGRADGRVSTRALGRVTRLLRDLHVFERRSRKTDEAGRCNPVRDQGDVFNIHMNGKYRVLIDRKGCRGAFGRDELKVLRTAIEQVAGVHAWRQGRDRYGVAGQTRWNIP